MTDSEGEGRASHEDDGMRTEAGMTASTRDISENQTRYILDNFPDAAVYPPRADNDPDAAPVEFIYRRRHLLTRDQDLRSVLNILDPSRATVARRTAELPEAGEVTHPIPGLALVELTGGPADPLGEAQVLFGALQVIEQELGAGKAAPEHAVHITAAPPPATDCPATEPDWVPAEAPPLPGISRSRCDGRGTLVAVVDTGLVKETAAWYPWLHGVVGDPDLQVHEGTSIERYGGHGTFIASIIRAMAPRADVQVVRIFEKAGAIYETDIVKALLEVLDRAPDVISLSAGTHTWLDGGLLSFQVFVEGPLREREGTVLVAAAGNDGAGLEVLARGDGRGDRRRGARRTRGRARLVLGLRRLGQGLRARPGPGARLRPWPVQVPGGAGWPGGRVRRHGQVERNLVLDSGGVGADRRPDVGNRRELP